MVQPPTDVCLKLGPASVKEVVGTFKNGTLEGVAKITYLDGHKSIANFKNHKQFFIHVNKVKISLKDTIRL